MITRIVPLAALIAGLAAAPASAATLTVDDDRVQCPTAPFTSVQAAVTAASAGDVVLVCQGKYVEAVEIGAGKDNVRVLAKETQAAIIQAPNLLGPQGSIVHITGGVTGVRFERFVVQGPGNGTLRFGILVDSGAVAAAIRDNYVRVIRNNTPTISPGNAVAVGDPFSGTPGIVRDFTNNRLERYVQTGVLVTNPGSQAVISTSRMTGTGEQGITENNGVVVEDGALARVTGNDIIGHAGLGQAFGIFFNGAAPASSANHNRVYDNETGLGLRGTSQALIRANDVKRNDRGITADSASTQNRFEYNDAVSNLTIDCEDDSAGSGTAGTANTWIGNQGIIDAPDVCRP